MSNYLSEEKAETIVTLKQLAIQLKLPHKPNSRKSKDV